ncbi:tRNA1(Val) (adenine(37)-N6)-methyltransferase [Pseudooctadecabacter jejudonensis]|uniref:Ribosomal RNA small subunit methyltransferase C n=1 Tax=Pseudooctadecabacter jejudonensis TaxID=1391910 RepID=A0A1Y5T0B1_9RHOB|nr:methyltransferase [Pseudooctadecabacter jejudonensis]SLN53258.1 Ribosomal RNA small subunit methyltransferase C [Pseudooctadecabacter jejudonensis]
MTLASDTTLDDFLGGRLTLEQPSTGYRAGVDPVLLAAAVPATAGQSVLELGCGTGAAMLCLAARVPGLTLTGVEVQDRYADLCRANAARNEIAADIHTADLRAMPTEIRGQSFDHVIMNPPYFDPATGNPSAARDKDTAFRGDTDLRDWVDQAARRLRHKGHLTLIQKAHRLADVLAAMDDRMGSIVVTPIAGRTRYDADRVLVRARKGGRAAFRLTAPVVLHTGSAHTKDREDYRPEIAAILRNGAAFPNIG